MLFFSSVLPAALLLFSLIHPSGFVNENLRLKNIQYSQEGFSGGAGGERKSDAPEVSLSLNMFKIMKKPPNYFANVDFNEKATVISHSNLFSQSCLKSSPHSLLIAFSSNLLFPHISLTHIKGQSVFKVREGKRCNKGTRCN